MFDVEKDTESERSLSNFGGAYNNTSDVCAHDDLIVVGGVFKKKFATISMFPHAGDCSEICFDTSDEEESIENDIVDSEFPFYTDKSYINQSDDFKVPPSSLLDEDKYCDHHIFIQHFQNSFSELVTNQFFQCEEFSVSNKSDVMSKIAAKRRVSDFTYPSHPDTQGELHFLGICNSLNEVEYQTFVFSIEGIHESVSDHQYQFNINSCDHVDLHYHSEQCEESSSGLLHYENEGDGFDFPNDMNQRSNVLDKTKGSQSFSLPQRDISQNQVFDRGRKL